jgi:hypothetical protein
MALDLIERAKAPGVSCWYGRQMSSDVNDNQAMYDTLPATRRLVERLLEQGINPDKIKTIIPKPPPPPP